MSGICQLCGSRHFAGERSPERKFTIGYRRGKNALGKALDANGNELHDPHLLHDLMMNPVFHNFRENILSWSISKKVQSIFLKFMAKNFTRQVVFKHAMDSFHSLHNYTISIICKLKSSEIVTKLISNDLLVLCIRLTNY